MTRPVVFAVAFSHAELALVIRVMRETVERADSPLAADIVAMLENALDDRDLAWLGMSPVGDTPAGEEVAP